MCCWHIADTKMLTGVFLWGHDKMRSGADRHWSVLIIRSFDWSAFCHFFQQFVYNNQQLQPQPTANPNTNPNHIPNPISNPNPTMITDLQIGLIDPQIVTIQIRPADPLRSAFCPVPFLSWICWWKFCWPTHQVIFFCRRDSTPTNQQLWTVHKAWNVPWQQQ